jgi:hypothetical protein
MSLFAGPVTSFAPTRFQHEMRTLRVRSGRSRARGSQQRGMPHVLSPQVSAAAAGDGDEALSPSAMAANTATIAPKPPSTRMSRQPYAPGWGFASANRTA